MIVEHQRPLGSTLWWIRRLALTQELIALEAVYQRYVRARFPIPARLLARRREVEDILWPRKEDR